MADFFIDDRINDNPPKTKRKTKKEMSNEQYEQVCKKMADLRARRKGLIKPTQEELDAKLAKAEKALIKKNNIQIVERIIEKPVEKIVEVEKVIEKPVEIVKEIIKEIPAISKQKSSMYIDEDELFSNIKELKSMVLELKESRKSTQSEDKPAPVPQTASDPKPEKFIYMGARRGFKKL
jgi:hypothetical protein